MKKFALLFFFLLSVALNAQDDGVKPLELDTVIQVNDASKQQIYDGLKTWFVENAKVDSRFLLQIDNKDDGLLQGKLTYEVVWNNLTWAALTGYVEIVFNIQIREGRFRLKLYNVTHISTEPNRNFARQWSQGLVYIGGYPPHIKGLAKKPYSKMQDKVIPLFKVESLSMINSMKNNIVSGASNDNDDW